jgi:hypothetical protein
MGQSLRANTKKGSTQGKEYSARTHVHMQLSTHFPAAMKVLSTFRFPEQPVLIFNRLRGAGISLEPYVREDIPLEKLGIGTKPNLSSSKHRSRGGGYRGLSGRKGMSNIGTQQFSCALHRMDSA